MAVNRILYLASLTGAAIFYFASGTWFAWAALVLLLALPWVSLLFSLPAMLCVRLGVSLPERVEQGDRASMHLKLSGLRWLPLPDVQVRLDLQSRDVPHDHRFLSRLARTDGVLDLSTAHSGWVCPVLKKARCYDALGLFHLRLKVVPFGRMAVLPPAIPPQPQPNLELALSPQLRPKPGGGFSELHDHRPYRPGDPVKGIHWKLSVKADKLIVREPLERVRQTVIVAVPTPQGPEARDRVLGALRWTSDALLARGVVHTVAYMDGEQLQTVPVADADQAAAALVGACLAAENSLPLPVPLGLRADCLLRVGTEGGTAP